MNEITILVSDEEAFVLDLAKLARENGLLLVTNGKRAALAPEVPAGWTRIGVSGGNHALH